MYTSFREQAVTEELLGVVELGGEVGIGVGIGGGLGDRVRIEVGVRAMEHVMCKE